MFLFFSISLFLCKFCFSRETTTVKNKLKLTAQFLFEEQAKNVMEKIKKEEGDEEEEEEKEEEEEEEDEEEED